MFHALIPLSAAVLFLFGQEFLPADPLLFLAFPLLAAVVVLVLIWWKSNWSAHNWPGRLGLILADLVLALWIFLQPEQSMQVFLIVLGVWAALIAVLLLWNYRKLAGLRAALILSGFLFLVISGYLFWQSTQAETMNLMFLGIVLGAFSLFLILISLQLRSKSKKAEAAKAAPAPPPN